MLIFDNMETYSDSEDISNICSVLSNKKRVRLLKSLYDVNGRRLREIHEQTSEVTGLSHRETTHAYLEKLADASLIQKRRDESGDVQYQSKDKQLIIELVLASKL